MVLSDIDRRLLQHCLARDPGAWDSFVDRFLGLVLHVVNHTTQGQQPPLADADREDLVADVFVALLDHDSQVLRRFRGESSLATYLTVVARRIVIRRLSQGAHSNSSLSSTEHDPSDERRDLQPIERIGDRDEVERLMATLNEAEADIVRLYHLEGLTYREISHQVGMPENSIGPTLSRARLKMRRASADTPHA